jgi:hypothetical protein
VIRRGIAARQTRDPEPRWLPCRDSRSHPGIPACVDAGIRFPLARKGKLRRSSEIANSEIEADKHHERDKPLIALGRTVRDDKHAAVVDGRRASPQRAQISNPAGDCGGCSGPPPTPPAESRRPQDQARQASTGDGTGDGGPRAWASVEYRPCGPCPKNAL